jgi:FlaG/FlaF family flagellin (archaellin)
MKAGLAITVILFAAVASAYQPVSERLAAPLPHAKLAGTLRTSS